MSKLEQIKKQIDKLYYWDMPLLNLCCNYFADEVVMSYMGDNSIVTYIFLNCYEVKFNHALSYKKLSPTKDLNFNQIPYFMQEVSIKEVEHSGEEYYHCYVNIPPLTVEILCKDIELKEEVETRV